MQNCKDPFIFIFLASCSLIVIVSAASYLKFLSSYPKHFIHKRHVIPSEENDVIPHLPVIHDVDIKHHSRKHEQQMAQQKGLRFKKGNEERMRFKNREEMNQSINSSGKDKKHKIKPHPKKIIDQEKHVNIKKTNNTSEKSKKHKMRQHQKEIIDRETSEGMKKTNITSENAKKHKMEPHLKKIIDHEKPVDKKETKITKEDAKKKHKMKPHPREMIDREKTEEIKKTNITSEKDKKHKMGSHLQEKN